MESLRRWNVQIQREEELVRGSLWALQFFPSHFLRLRENPLVLLSLEAVTFPIAETSHLALCFLLRKNEIALMTPSKLN